MRKRRHTAHRKSDEASIGYIDLSKRRVSPEDITKCEERYNKSKTVASIMRHVASKSSNLEEAGAESIMALQSSLKFRAYPQRESITLWDNREVTYQVTKMKD